VGTGESGREGEWEGGSEAGRQGGLGVGGWSVEDESVR